MPDDLSTLSPGQQRKALEQRRALIAKLAEDGKRAGASQRPEILAEMRTASAEAARLVKAGADWRDGSAMEEIQSPNVGPPAPEPKRPDTPAERAVSAIRDQWTLSGERIGDLRLHPGNLTDTEGEELYALLELRHLPDAPGWNEAQRARFEAFVEKLAGEPVFENMHADIELAAFAEQVRRDTLTRRRELVEAEIGSVRLPASVFDRLRSSKGRGWTVGDAGALAVLLNAFELRDASLIERGSFEDDVLVAKSRLKFVARVNAPVLDVIGGSRVELDLEWLAREGWFEVRKAGGRIEVRLGPKATALREGRPS